MEMINNYPSKYILQSSSSSSSSASQLALKMANNFHSDSVVMKPNVGAYLGLMMNNNNNNNTRNNINPSSDDVVTDVSAAAAAGGDNKRFVGTDHHQVKSVVEEEEMKKKGEKKMKKTKYAFQTRSQVDILDDGYRWRKYGQKAVKNNKFPRSYYRCTQQGCNVKKQVQRLSKDEGIVVTTYEGIHSHPIHSHSTDNFEHILTQMQIYSTPHF